MITSVDVISIATVLHTGPISIVSMTFSIVSIVYVITKHINKYFFSIKIQK